MTQNKIRLGEENNYHVKLKLWPLKLKFNTKGAQAHADNL